MKREFTRRIRYPENGLGRMKNATCSTKDIENKPTKAQITIIVGFFIAIWTDLLIAVGVSELSITTAGGTKNRKNDIMIKNSGYNHG